MNPSTKLTLIAARCKTDVAAYGICENILSDAQKRAMSASKSTLAAIDWLDGMTPQVREAVEKEILAAWPDELLL